MELDYYERSGHYRDIPKIIHKNIKLLRHPYFSLCLILGFAGCPEAIGAVTLSGLNYL